MKKNDQIIDNFKGYRDRLNNNYISNYKQLSAKIKMKKNMIKISCGSHWGSKKTGINFRDI